MKAQQQQTQKNVQKRAKNLAKTDIEAHVAGYLHILTFVKAGKCSNIVFWFI